MKNIKYIVFSLLLIFCILLVGNNSINKTTYIESVLSSNYYSSLPIKAKEFIKESYYETGNIILLEDNKKDNFPYLNPDYINYLSLSENEKNEVSVIPDIYSVDFENEIQSLEGTLPSSYDSRNVNGKNYVTPNKDQGSTSLCWAYSTTSLAESYVLRQSNTSYSSSSSMLFSERQIDYATTSNVIKNYAKTPYSSGIRDLGEGGNFLFSTFPLASGTSLFNTKNFNTSNTSERELSEVLSINKSEYEMNSSIYSITNPYRESTSTLTTSQANTRKNILDLVKKSIMDYGGAYVGTFWNSNCMVTYKGNTLLDVYNCSYKDKEGHALEIIGWDDDYKYEYCITSGYHNTGSCDSDKKVEGQGVWILKNSWGNDFSYPYLTYDSMYSNISIISNMTKTSERNWDNTYSIGSGLNATSSYTLSMSNTEIRDTEIVKKVKFLAYTASSSYTVKILKDDSTYAEVNASSDYPGLITVDIPDEVRVNSNSKITISSSNGQFKDKVLIFTKNINAEPYVDLSSFGKSYTSGTKTLYSITKNIPSGTKLVYKLIGSSGNDESKYLNISNNEVAVNNVNTYLSINSGLQGDHYKLIVSYNDSIAGMHEFNYGNLQGNGTSSNPYIIHNTFEFGYLNEYRNSFFKLNNDLDFSESTSEGGLYYNDGYGFKGINEFSGSLDGDGHTIRGLYQNNYIDKDNVRYNGNGLFFILHGNATIKNLNFEDYDITCSSGYCGSLFSMYIGTDGSNNTVTISNVSLKNGKLRAVDELNETYVGGVYGTLYDLDGNLNINNVYIDSYVENLSSGASGYFAYNISSGDRNPTVNISNIELLGSVKGTLKSLFNLFDYNEKENQKINISNVISNMNYDSLGHFTSSSSNSVININNMNIIKNNNDDFFDNVIMNDSINIIDPNEIIDFTNEELYSSWNDFNTNWEIKIIDNVKRIPVLKFVDFDYSSVSNLSVFDDDTTYTNIYDLIDKVSNDRILYEVEDDSIISINDSGDIIPIKVGVTNIIVKNLYDCFVGNILVEVCKNYSIITYYSNNEQNINSIQKVVNGSNSKLLKNSFIYDGYTFVNWNTMSDGSGTSYNDEETILVDSNIDLYAIWKESFSYIINDLSYDDENSIIYDLKPNTSFDDLFSHITLNSNYSLSKESDLDIVGTNNKLKIFKNDELVKEYTLIVLGDINSDGKINSMDYIKIRKHIMGTGEIKDLVFFKAADVNRDDKITSLDYIKIRKYIMNGGEL